MCFLFALKCNLHSHITRTRIRTCINGYKNYEFSEISEEISEFSEITGFSVTESVIRSHKNHFFVKTDFLSQNVCFPSYE